MLTNFFRWHAAYVDFVAYSQRRCWTFGLAAGSEWKLEVLLKVVVPAERLLLWPIRVNDDLPIEPMVKIGVTSSAGH